jgi:hypothetical protein
MLFAEHVEKRAHDSIGGTTTGHRHADDRRKCYDDSDTRGSGAERLGDPGDLVFPVSTTTSPASRISNR